MCRRIGEAVVVHSAEQQKRLHAKGQAIEAMERVAAKGSTIQYSQLAAEISAVSYAPNGSPFSELLCEISRRTHHKRGVLLSAVVVHKDDELPGTGFFQLASDLGHEVDDDQAFHQTALREVHREYSASTS